MQEREEEAAWEGETSWEDSLTVNLTGKGCEISKNSVTLKQAKRKMERVGASAYRRKNIIKTTICSRGIALSSIHTADATFLYSLLQGQWIHNYNDKICTFITKKGLDSTPIPTRLPWWVCDEEYACILFCLNHSSLFVPYIVYPHSHRKLLRRTVN